MTITLQSRKYGQVEFLIDDEDYDKIKDLNLYVWGSKRHTSLYILYHVRTQVYRLHRLLMNAKSKDIVDHINGNGLDNRKSNLRITDSQGNNMNACKRRGNLTSKFKGVSYCSRRKRWIAQIQYQKKKISLGGYHTEMEAKKAYDDKALTLFGEYMRK